MPGIRTGLLKTSTVPVIRLNAGRVSARCRFRILTAFMKPIARFWRLRCMRWNNFYKTLKKYRLPGIDKSTRIKFFITNYQDCYEGKICFSVEEELKKSARTHKELSVTTTNDGFVLGLEDEVYNQYINDEKYLKKFPFSSMIKKCGRKRGRNFENIFWRNIY